MMTLQAVGQLVQHSATESVSQRTGMLRVFGAFLLVATAAVPLQSQALHRRVLLDGTKQILFDLGRIIPLEGGGFAVVDNDDDQLLLINAEGDSVARIGHKGSGPGEANRIGDLGADDSTIWISDWPNKIIRYARDGSVIEEARFPQTLTSPGHTRITAMQIASWPIRGGAIVFAMRPGTGQVPSGMVMATATPDADNVAKFLAFFAVRPNCPLGNGSRSSSPFCGKAFREASSNGEWILTVDPGSQQTPVAQIRISVLHSDGDTVYTTTHSFPAYKLTRADIDSVTNYYASLAPGQEAFLEKMRSGSHPERMRAIDRAILTNTGRAWLEVRKPDNSGKFWVVLDSTGHQIRTVAFPGNFRLANAIDGIAVGVETTESGLENLVEYRLGRPR